jgi:hypothetical protein
MAHTQPCTEAIKGGRMRKASQFRDAATTIREFADDEAAVGDAFVTLLLVHAGIAAADAICCHELGEHAHGESHNEAVRLIRRVTPDGGQLAKALDTLLGAKTRAGYGHEPVTKDRSYSLLARGRKARTRGTRPAICLVAAIFIGRSTTVKGPSPREVAFPVGSRMQCPQRHIIRTMLRRLRPDVSRFQRAPRRFAAVRSATPGAGPRRCRT